MGFLGITCLNCKKTSLKRDEKKSIEWLADQILKDPLRKRRGKEFIPKIRYHSNISSNPMNFSAGFITCDIHGNKYISQPDQEQLLDGLIENDAANLGKQYASCVPGFAETAGSILGIYLCSEDDIINGIKVEVEDSKRLFPRYIYRNKTVELIEAMIADFSLASTPLLQEVLAIRPELLIEEKLNEIEEKDEITRRMLSVFGSRHDEGRSADILPPLPPDIMGPDEIENITTAIKSNPNKRVVRNAIYKSHTKLINGYIELIQKWPVSRIDLEKFKGKILREVYKELSSEENARPDAYDRELCREFARGIWKKDPGTQTAAILKRDDFHQFCKANNLPYAESTYYNWIHGDCPNPKRGRPRGKKKQPK